MQITLLLTNTLFHDKSKVPVIAGLASDVFDIETFLKQI